MDWPPGIPTRSMRSCPRWSSRPGPARSAPRRPDPKASAWPRPIWRSPPPPDPARSNRSGQWPPALRRPVPTPTEPAKRRHSCLGTASVDCPSSSPSRPRPATTSSMPPRSRCARHTPACPPASCWAPSPGSMGWSAAGTSAPGSRSRSTPESGGPSRPMTSSRRGTNDRRPNSQRQTTTRRPRSCRRPTRCDRRAALRASRWTTRARGAPARRSKRSAGCGRRG